MTSVHRTRAALRAALAGGRRLTGLFVKLPSTDVLELAAAAGFDLVVVDLEHSALTHGEARELVRFADVLGLPALVRLPAVDAGVVNRLLESGAVGIQLSTLASTGQRRALQAAVTCGPGGGRSVSLAHRAAGFGAAGLAAHLAAEAADPPLLVGQIEGPVTDPLAEVLAGLDVAFVGTTDLTVALGIDPADTAAVGARVQEVARAAAEAGVTFGGWAPSPDAVVGLGLGAAGYLLIGSDLQFLGSALRAGVPTSEDR
jgi:2-keto-3-deoxy-L-rhamnonate aldolase RhmA